MWPFIVDSNFFIQAHRDTYPLDVASSFWDKISNLAKDGKIISIDKVHKEICRNTDALSTWFHANLKDEFFLDSGLVMSQYASVIQTAERRIPAYNQRAKDEFYDSEEADAWLIAHALRLGSPVVTHEIGAPLKIAKVQIPDICSLVDIKTVSTIEMFRLLGERF